eukprot:Clim_evm63s22 gene=Clim_evmTU63s22
MDGGPPPAFIAIFVIIGVLFVVGFCTAIYIQCACFGLIKRSVDKYTDPEQPQQTTGPYYAHTVSYGVNPHPAMGAPMGTPAGMPPPYTGPNSVPIGGIDPVTGQIRTTAAPIIPGYDPMTGAPSTTAPGGIDPMTGQIKM